MAGRTTLWVVTGPGVMRGVGLKDIIDLQAQSGWSNANPPANLRAGESYSDGKPAGVPVLNPQDFSSSTDVWTAFQAVENAITSPCYLHIDRPYYINTLHTIGSSWYGYANSSRKIMGGIGDGPDVSSINEVAGMVPSAARTAALAPPEPLPLYDLYFSNTSSTAPIFFSGLGFNGLFQGPYGVQTSSGISVNASVPSPIPHHGLQIWRTIPGSRIQFCRFRGFAFAQKASPSLEVAGLETNYDNGLVVYRTEIDGRLPTGEVSAGGYMANFTQDLTVQDSWLHDTRRSGFAIHEHGGGDNGTYLIDNFQVEAIATASDSFSGSGLGFNASNVEEVSGTMTFTGARFALDRGYDITLGTTAGGPVAQHIYVNDFHSLSAAWNGCLVVRIIKTPNSAGTSPYWNLYNTGGLSALPITAKWGNTTLTPVASTSFNSTVHTPDKNYVVVTS